MTRADAAVRLRSIACWLVVGSMLDGRWRE